MDQKHLHLDGELLWTGVRKSASRSEDPILCLVNDDRIKFISLSGLRLLALWETQLRSPVSGRLALVFPPVIVNLLSCEIIRSRGSVGIIVQDNQVTLRLADHLGSYELGWQSDLSAFPAPPEFSEIIQVPKTLMEVPYLKVSDAAHEAVARLVQMELQGQIDRTKLAILIALDFGGFSVNGQEIVGVGTSAHYFDPRLVIRALEFVKGQTVRVGIAPLKDRRRAFLALLSQQGDWTVYCSLLSIGLETQRLYPLPPGRNR